MRISSVLPYLLLMLAAAPAPVGLAGAVHPSGTPDVPPEALAALRGGRYWKASQILDQYLASANAPTPDAILLAAQANAGWAAWSKVRDLLTGRSWLDQARGGYGWELLGHAHFELRDYSQSADDYGRFLRVGTDVDPRELGLAQLQRGLALARDSDADAALRAFTAAGSLIPQLDDWIELYAARAAAAAGDTAELRRRLAATAPDLAAPRGWELRTRASALIGDTATALDLADSAARYSPSAGERAEAWNLVAGLQLARADTAAARRAYDSAMRIAPADVAAVDAARRLGNLPAPTAAEQLEIGRIYLRHGNVERGIAGLSAYLEHGRPTAHERRVLRYDLARASFEAGRYREAEHRLLEAVEDPPGRAEAADGLYLAGRAQYREGRTDRALRTFRAVARRFPGTDPATRSLFLVADLAHDRGDTATARIYYHRTIGNDGNAADAGLAFMRLGDMAAVRGDWRTAADVYDEYRERHPRGRHTQEATYWAARAHGALGQTRTENRLLKDAWRLDPLSYYGIKAAQRLGLPLQDAPLVSAPAVPDSVHSAVAAAMDRLDLLRAIDDDAAAHTEIGRMEQRFRSTSARYLLAEALNSRGYTAAGIALGHRIYDVEGAWNPRLLRIVYPFPYRDVVFAEADERGLDPFLVAGLIRQESMFTASARSAAGAIGLMQVLPSTGRLLSDSGQINDFSASMLRQPEINIHLGTAFLKDLVDTYDVGLPAVLAAYNAGTSRVERWRQFPEWDRPELFTERIPFSETREYVRLVQRNTDIYRMLYGGAGASAGESSGPDPRR
jgi:peptidoglycan lytic transglycosylase